MSSTRYRVFRKSERKQHIDSLTKNQTRRLHSLNFTCFQLDFSSITKEINSNQHFSLINQPIACVELCIFQIFQIESNWRGNFKLKQKKIKKGQRCTGTITHRDSLQVQFRIWLGIRVGRGIEEELQFARALCVNVLIETELKNHQRFIWHKGRKRTHTHIGRTQSLAAPREADR